MISIVIPVYNTPKEKLLRAKASLDSQLEQRFEAIWFDDGSKGETATFLDSFASDKHQVVHEENHGIYEARRQGFLLSKGEYVLFLDSDDYLEPDALSSLLSEAKRTGSRMVIASFFSHKEGKKKGSPWFFRGRSERMDERKFLLRYIRNIKIRGFVWGRLYARSLLEEVYPFPYPDRLFEDVCFTLVCGMKAKDVAYLNKPIYHYMIGNGESLTGKPHPRRVEDHVYAYTLEKELLEKRGDEKAIKAFRRLAFWMHWNLLFDAKISVKGGLDKKKAKRIVKEGMKGLKEKASR